MILPTINEGKYEERDAVMSKSKDECIGDTGQHSREVNLWRRPVEGMRGVDRWNPYVGKLALKKLHCYSQPDRQKRERETSTLSVLGRSRKRVVESE